jgi:hypothetical protein
VASITKETALEQHVKILAILNIVMGILGVIVAVCALALFGGIAMIVGADGDADAPMVMAMLGSIGVIAFAVVAVLSVPCIIAGYGLLHHRPWAPTMTIIVSAVNLMDVPFGTALGIYGLWVLLNKDTKPLFQQGAIV